MVCLANSKKYGERCIAGIVVEQRDGRLETVHTGQNRPQWIRPVTSEVHGQVPAKLVKDVKLGDLLQVQVLEPVPDMFQQENMLFQPKSLKNLNHVRFTNQTLQQILHKEVDLFVNKLNRVPSADIAGLDHSLLLVHVTDFQPRIEEIYYKPTLRGTFTWEGTVYDMPVTDVNFNLLFRENPEAWQTKRPAWLTISVGLEYEGFHYKLIAGVLSADDYPPSE